MITTTTKIGTILLCSLMSDWGNVSPSGFCTFFICARNRNMPPRKRKISTPEDTFPTKTWKTTTNPIANPRRPSMYPMCLGNGGDVIFLGVKSRSIRSPRGVVVVTVFKYIFFPIVYNNMFLTASKILISIFF